MRWKDSAIVELIVDNSSAQMVVSRGAKGGKVKNLHCYKPLPGNDW